ncbi:MAG TPA: NAD-dependent epimerase/dehydratase family protein [Bryobacteraceae bacterium]|nr:NAD-dependent epimerase/dehydratase family protein [Bryobacteraceae bacterium]
MKILVIGGTGFIGPYVVRRLADQGHQVAVFHRGEAKPKLPDSVERILGDRGNLAESRSDFLRFSPDVVVDMILGSERQAKATMDAFRGITRRVVALSSGDVYRAAGILHGTEPGPLQPVPLTEESELRTHGQTYRKEVMDAIRVALPWLDDGYDKIPVERVIMNGEGLAGTVLRLPMTYGPGDHFHRLHPYLKRMDDRRPAILIQQDAAGWRGPRGYVENVAAGIALAATSSQAAGRIYNLAELPTFSELEWASQIGRIVGWQGSVLAVPVELTPPHLRVPYNSAQDWIMSSERIRRELGYAEPVPFEAGMRRSIEWERRNPPAPHDPKQFDYAAEDAALEQLRAS